MSTDNSDSAPAAAPSGEQVTLESVRARIDAIEAQVKHDVIAFLTSLVLFPPLNKNSSPPPVASVSPTAAR